MNTATHTNDPAFIEPPKCCECDGDMLPELHDECEFVCENIDCGHSENWEPEPDFG